MEDAVRRVVRESDEVRIAQAQIEVTDAQVTSARAAGLPQARLSSQYSQVLRNARAEIVGQTIFGQNYNYTGNVNFSQVLFQGGRVFAGARAAGDARRAASHSRAETEATLAVDVQRAYLNAQLARELLQIQERNAQLATERLALVEQLERGGRASRFDVLRSRVERANLEPQVLVLRHFRDRVLLQHRWGRAFVAWYYRTSPPIADWIRERDWARALARWLLTPVVYAVKYPPLAALMLAVCLVVVRRRREALASH